VIFDTRLHSIDQLPFKVFSKLQLSFLKTKYHFNHASEGKNLETAYLQKVEKKIAKK
jgi:hypothetical protein